jgi:hypothetical protein
MDEIVIDGILNEPAWQNAQAVGNFAALGANRDSDSPRTSVKILTDGKNIFPGFVCNERNILLHLIANADGCEYDTSGTIQGTIVTENKKWNGSWETAASKGRVAWFSEWKIPLSELGVSKTFPASMGINLCRTRVRDSITYNSWSPCRMRFIEPDNLGDLILPSESGEYCFVDYPRGAVFSANHPLPELDIRSFYNSQKRFRLAYIIHGPDAGEQTGYSEFFLFSRKPRRKFPASLSPGLWVSTNFLSGWRMRIQGSR